MRYSSLGVLLSLLALASCNGNADPDGPEVPQPGDAAASDDGMPTTDAAASQGDGSKNGTGDSVEVPAPLKLLEEKEIADGWVSLFDGRTLFGWQANDKPDAGGADWHLEEGVIVATESEKPSLLLTAVRFSNFDLRLDYRLEKGGNSGVFLRTVANPTDPTVDCYELNMCNTHPEFPTGSIVGRQRTEMDENDDSKLPAEGEWHTIQVRVEGNQIVARFDGRILVDMVDESDHQIDIGFIGLQHNQGKIEFRNISLRPLGTSPLFDGTSLAGWRPVPDSKSEFKVADEAIHVNSGPGFLESEKTWGDFVLQFDTRINAADVNGGVFFRAETGTAEHPSNGYELQICNSFADGNRAKPNDYKGGFGTGAIMHRAAARYIVGNDKEWMTMTLVADGRRFATWVNGFPTANWVDERDPNDNPRNGYRAEAGHLSLQGHDDETDISFRRIRILSVASEKKSE